MSAAHFDHHRTYPRRATDSFDRTPDDTFTRRLLSPSALATSTGEDRPGPIGAHTPSQTCPPHDVTHDTMRGQVAVLNEANRPTTTRPTKRVIESSAWATSVVDLVDRSASWTGWSADQPRLADFASLTDVVEAWTTRDSRCYRVVAGLTALGSRRGRDDDLAALAVVALLDSGVARVATSLRDLCEANDVRTAVWEEVKLAEPQLDAMAARYLLARARQRLSRPAGGMMPRVETVSLEQCLGERWGSESHASSGSGRGPSDGDPLLAIHDVENPRADLTDLLRWATATGVVTRSEVDLIVELMVAENRGLPRERAQELIGQRHGVAMRTIRRRRDATTARLRESAARYLAATA